MHHLLLQYFSPDVDKRSSNSEGHLVGHLLQELALLRVSQHK